MRTFVSASQPLSTDARLKKIPTMSETAQESGRSPVTPTTHRRRTTTGMWRVKGVAARLPLGLAGDMCVWLL
ncbi:hypothetical protein SCLCIDRAFT_1211898 [Scleroderma citrinum Foug A]|uniref:Uncharacterized protein n=1 Tax=Scleroderma citrinum Foug A TaxID=1036808 RepID=A0A0C3EC31_9AGAM|nr:hypothetical protein SCLCIDRAFT_1211898 [Scleroderma citrinum Foug A]